MDRLKLRKQLVAAFSLSLLCGYVAFRSGALAAYGLSPGSRDQAMPSSKLRQLGLSMSGYDSAPRTEVMPGSKSDSGIVFDLAPSRVSKPVQPPTGQGSKEGSLDLLENLTPPTFMPGSKSGSVGFGTTLDLGAGTRKEAERK